MKIDFLLPALTLGSLLLLSCSPSPRRSASRTDSGTIQPQSLAYFGTYTRDGKSRGIYAYRFEPETARMTEIGLVAEVANPSFLAVHPNNRFLYSVTEDSEGAVQAYSIDHTSGDLTLLNQVPSMGKGPCHLNVDATGRMLAVANYHSGSTVTFSIQPDGSLSQARSVLEHQGSSLDPKRQTRPHAHSVHFSPDNRFLIAADLGTDRLMVYRADPSTATIEAHTPSSARVNPGSGPRHFRFHPSGRFGYAINEMGNSVTAFAYDAGLGALRHIQRISTLPESHQGLSHTAEIQIHPGGRFLYGSNRGHDSIAVFSIDPSNGRLVLVQHVSTQGKTPRHFGLDPTGQYLVAQNQDTDNAVIFEIDPDTGRLTPTGQTLRIPSPVCVRFVPLD